MPHLPSPLKAFACGALFCMLVGCQPQRVSLNTASKSKTRVKTVAVTQVDLQKTTTQPASVNAFFETEICSRVAGYVSEVIADIGDRVEAGQVLARIDVPEIEKRRSVLDARIQLLRSKEQESLSGVQLSEASVAAAQASLQQSRSMLMEEDAILVAAQAELERTQDLVRRGSLQQRLLDEAQKKYDSAQASRSAAESAVRSSESNVLVAEAEVMAAKAKYQASLSETSVAERQLEELDVLIGFAEIRAPFQGVVTKRSVQLGSLIGGSLNDASSSLFTLSQIDRLRIHIPVPEVNAPFVQAGDGIELTFPSFASEPAIEAKVSRMSGSLDPKTRTITVEAELENSDGKLLPGMFGEAKILIEANVSTAMLPSRAVRFDESGNAYVYLLNESNEVAVTPIVVGMDSGNQIEVRSGIATGQLVIGPHLDRFTDGELVTPM